MFLILYTNTNMELIFENAKSKKGGSGLTGASKGGNAPGLTGAGSTTGAGKKYDGKQLGQIARHHTALYGGGWFGDFCDGFKQGFTGVMNTALLLMDMIPGVNTFTAPLHMANNLLGGKKPRKPRGGAVHDPVAVAQGKEAFDKLVKENVKAPIVGGGRSTIVKNIMAKKGLSLMEASKYVKSNNLYKSKK